MPWGIPDKTGDQLDAEPFHHYTIGPFIQEKISRGLHKTRTPRINGTKSMFTAYSTQGQLKPRLILAEGFWDGLIQAAAYLGRESLRINALTGNKHLNTGTDSN